MAAIASRTMATLVAAIVLVYSIAPLVEAPILTADICCAGSDDCPSGYRCASDSEPCSLQAEGRCILVPGT